MFIRPNHIQNRLLPSILVCFGLTALTGCKKAEYIPGKGSLLQVSLEESDANSMGSVGFTRTNQSIQSPDFEMECIFTDGSMLRSPSQGSGAIVCYLPFPKDLVIPQVATSMTITEADLLALPAAPRSDRKPASGRYKISKPHPGYQWGCKATFQTTLLPIQFRFVQKGVSTSWVKIDLITQ